jgi:anti-anti-sigma factor
MGERISEQIRRSPQVVVDMDGVNYLGSSCLSEMVWLHKQAAERGTQLHWAGAKDSVVARPLAITGLSRVLAIHSAPADAVVAGLRLGHLLDHGAGAEPRRAVTA